MALKGFKVIEMAGLAPVPMCGMILADFGAQVTRIDKTLNSNFDVLKGGKRTIALDLKKSKATEIVRKICKVSDVIIEPFRPGVMEKLGLGPEVLLKDNPKLIYARLTGFGADGRGLYGKRAGHDINYIATSGVLSMFGRKGENPYAPVNFAADFAGGGLLCAFGICTALLERERSGKGQIVDSAMVDGSAYVASWMFRSRDLPIWGNSRGDNMLDGKAHFYETYETKDGKFMAVGAIEPQFYALLLQGLELTDEQAPQFDNFEESKQLFTQIFKSKTQSEWTAIFDGIDACVTPVLDWHEAPNHPHNKDRNVFRQKTDESDPVVPNPAPRLSRTPAKSQYGVGTDRDYLEMAVEIMGEIGVGKEEMKGLVDDGVLVMDGKAKL
ncbi:alpha-methylacyl-CoA racemase [Chironomus tepperi]|uniref:alpha-methylacyl-CoA racemase n=1 Tax=Chironomus tepperi TaxID=113505 RepID=UPI00391F2AC1